MPRILTTQLNTIKNRIADKGAWLMLLDIMVPTTPTPLYLYIVNNNEDVEFGTPPQIYTAYPFSAQLPDQTSNGEWPSTTLSVHDVDHSLRRYIDDLNGGYGTTITLRLIHSEVLDDASDYDALTLYFDLLEATIVDQSINFKIGAPNLMRQASPPYRYLANHCAWASHYGGVECKLPLTSSDGFNRTAFPTCNGTRQDCDARNNSKNFGGYPGLSEKMTKVA
jgi:phage-related protein